jgi:hypothetical protein
VSKYLDKGGSKLAALRVAVNTDPVLQDLTQTPLLLNIMSLAFQGAGGNELATQKGDSPEARQKQIFRLYVDEMFQRKGSASREFPKEKIIVWLSWLAGKMKEQSRSVFLVEGLEPSWLGTRAKRAAYGTLVALSLGLIFGMGVGLIFGLIAGLNRGGSAVIKHYALRLTLWLNGYTPFNFIKFLDRCAKLILLKKVGGGYIFIHRMLLEYFAELDASRNSASRR